MLQNLIRLTPDPLKLNSKNETRKKKYAFLTKTEKLKLEKRNTKKQETKKLEKAVRFDLNKPSLQEVNVKTTRGKDVRYTLLSLPLYMTELALSDEGSKR